MKIIPLTPDQAQILTDIKNNQELLRLRENELLQFAIGFAGILPKEVESIQLSPDGKAIFVQKKKREIPDPLDRKE